LTASATLQNFEALQDPLAVFTAAIQQSSADLRNHAEVSARVLNDVQNDWFIMGLEWRVGINAASKAHSDSLEAANSKETLWRSLGDINPEIAKVFKKDWERWSQVTQAVRAAIDEKLEVERRSTESLKRSPEAEALFLDGHEEGKRAYKAGDYDEYDLDELEQQSSSE
jgi:hypothetical protein